MNFDLHWITNKLVEVSVDEIKTGTLNKDESLELAKELIALASELLSVED